MKFIVSRDTLYKNLSAISGVLGTNSTMAILDNFLFTVEGSKLTLCASDLDSTMSAVIELNNVEGEGSVAIPSKILLDTFKLLNETTPVVFSIDTDQNIVRFTADNGEYITPCYPGDEFPKLPEIANPKTFDIDAQVLHRAISKTLFATGNDELRPNMMGILCELSEDYITFVSTDAHKLVRYRNSSVKSNEFASFILPKKPIAQLKNVISGLENPTIKVEYSDETHHIQFSFDNIVLFSSLKEGKYPNYEAVIPQENPHTFTVLRDDFLKSIRRVSNYSNQSTFQVRVSLGENTSITAEDIDYSNKANESIKGTYTGEPMDIGFNSKFLREMIENIDSTNINLAMSQPNRAALILPENNRQDEDLLMLIMPVMLNY